MFDRFLPLEWKVFIDIFAIVFTYLIYEIIKLTVKVIRHGVDDENIISEYQKEKTYKCYCLLLADFWKDHNTGIQQKYMNGDSLMWNEIWLDYQAEIVKTVSEVAMVDKSYLVSDGSSNDSKIQKNIYNDKYSIAFALFKLNDF